MKKYIPVLLSAIAAVSLSACATKTVTETTTAAPAATQAPAETSAKAEKETKAAADKTTAAAVAEALSQISDDTPVYVNCYTGQTSSQAVALLNAAGKYAANIQSGWNNGISKAEGYEAYIDTEEVPLPEDTYEVDPAIAQAVADYYKEASSNTIASFNFKSEALMELVDAESEDYTILSIRKAEDYANGHIAGAMNIPFGKGMQERFSEIPADKPVIVYCYSGQTSSQTMAILRLLGYEAYSLHGGMGKEGGAGWLGGGYPVVTE